MFFFFFLLNFKPNLDENELEKVSLCSNQQKYGKGEARYM